MEEMEKFIENMEKLLYANSLLKDVWLDLGPYTNNLSVEVKSRLNNFFEFDDSE